MVCRCRTNAQLVDHPSPAHIWADRFDIELADLSELQDAITGRIASSLHIQLLKAEHRRAISERPADPDRNRFGLHAMALLVAGPSPETIPRATDHRDRPNVPLTLLAFNCWRRRWGRRRTPWLGSIETAACKGFRRHQIASAKSVGYIASCSSHQEISLSPNNTIWGTRYKLYLLRIQDTPVGPRKLSQIGCFAWQTNYLNKTGTRPKQKPGGREGSTPAGEKALGEALKDRSGPLPRRILQMGSSAAQKGDHIGARQTPFERAVQLDPNFSRALTPNRPINCEWFRTNQNGEDPPLVLKR